MPRHLTTIQLTLFSLTYAAFLHLTTPDPFIRPWLHGVFGVAAIATYVVAQSLPMSPSSRLPHRLIRLLPWSLFAILWSIGTVGITHYWSDRLAARQGIEAVWFYGTSGTQFLAIQDVSVCWFLLVPAALISLLI